MRLIFHCIAVAVNTILAYTYTTNNPAALVILELFLLQLSVVLRCSVVLSTFNLASSFFFFLHWFADGAEIKNTLVCSRKRKTCQLFGIKGHKGSEKRSALRSASSLLWMLLLIMHTAIQHNTCTATHTHTYANMCFVTYTAWTAWTHLCTQVQNPCKKMSSVAFFRKSTVGWDSTHSAK